MTPLNGQKQVNGVGTGWPCEGWKTDLGLIAVEYSVCHSKDVGGFLCHARPASRISRRALVAEVTYSMV